MLLCSCQGIKHVLQECFYVFKNRILVQHIDRFKDHAKNVTAHIKNDYASEMSKHSTVVRFLSCVFVEIHAVSTLYAGASWFDQEK